jgi:pentapeptide repeat protein
VQTRLNGADLSNTDLSEALLLEADLCGANLRHADLSDADFNAANLSRADLTGADLQRAVFVDTIMEGSTLVGCYIYGISVWNVKLENAIQTNLVVTPGNEPVVQVDGLEVAQFIYLLLNNEKLRDVIDTIGKKAVLILGRFTAERKSVLDAIRDALRHCGYLPILFDFEKPSTRDTQETIVTLAGLVRFIIADITDPRSIPQELASVVPNFPSVPVQPLLQAGCEAWGMYDHIKRYQWVLPLHVYERKDTLLAELATKVIAPAEAKAKEQTGK